eukprot:TRINITY_DN1164_c0_g1_i1.p1 TRINITY_DN1164_c0_g1~~TRINITY_DN1164_c0_g1_i1.p1  ORF type:complete len:186 (-),score=29.79 TRINITY_DN1164_c0_g1_i1:72-629(-)
MFPVPGDQFTRNDEKNGQGPRFACGVQLFQDDCTDDNATFEYDQVSKSIQQNMLFAHEILEDSQPLSNELKLNDTVIVDPQSSGVPEGSRCGSSDCRYLYTDNNVSQVIDGWCPCDDMNESSPSHTRIRCEEYKNVSKKPRIENFEDLETPPSTPDWRGELSVQPDDFVDSDDEAENRMLWLMQQ